MFKLKFKQKMKPNFLLCLTLRRKTLEIHVRISRVTTNWFSFFYAEIFFSRVAHLIRWPDRVPNEFYVNIFNFLDLSNFFSKISSGVWYAKIFLGSELHQVSILMMYWRCRSSARCIVFEAF